MAVSDESRLPLALDLSLSELAGYRPLDALVRKDYLINANLMLDSHV